MDFGTQKRSNFELETYLKQKDAKCCRTQYLQCFVAFGTSNAIPKNKKKCVFEAFQVEVELGAGKKWILGGFGDPSWGRKITHVGSKKV